MEEIKDRFFKKPRLKWLVVIISIVLIASVTSIVFINHRPNNPFPKYITKDTTISLYYPVELPQNLKVNKDFRIISKNHLLYSVNNIAGNKFYINIEPAPSNFNFEQFKKNFSSPDEYITPIGRTVAGEAGTAIVAGILTDEGVLVLINTSSMNRFDDIKTISHALRLIKM